MRVKTLRVLDDAEREAVLTKPEESGERRATVNHRAEPTKPLRGFVR